MQRSLGVFCRTRKALYDLSPLDSAASPALPALSFALSGAEGLVGSLLYLLCDASQFRAFVADQNVLFLPSLSFAWLSF